MSLDCMIDPMEAAGANPNVRAGLNPRNVALVGVSE
jgi:hypothetical protein